MLDVNETWTIEHDASRMLDVITITASITVGDTLISVSVEKRVAMGEHSPEVGKVALYEGLREARINLASKVYAEIME